jgi:hypothetical protein
MYLRGRHCHQRPPSPHRRHALDTRATHQLHIAPCAARSREPNGQDWRI